MLRQPLARAGFHRSVAALWGISVDDVGCVGMQEGVLDDIQRLGSLAV